LDKVLKFSTALAKMTSLSDQLTCNY